MTDLNPLYQDHHFDQYRGQNVDEVVAEITRLGSFTQVVKTTLDSIHTMDVRDDRVRVYHDPKTQKVISVNQG